MSCPVSPVSVASPVVIPKTGGAVSLCKKAGKYLNTKSSTAHLDDALTQVVPSHAALLFPIADQSALNRFGLPAEISSERGETMNDGFTYTALKGTLNNQNFRLKSGGCRNKFKNAS